VDYIFVRLTAFETVGHFYLSSLLVKYDVCSILKREKQYRIDTVSNHYLHKPGSAYKTTTNHETTWTPTWTKCSRPSHRLHSHTPLYLWQRLWPPSLQTTWLYMQPYSLWQWLWPPSLQTTWFIYQVCWLNMTFVAYRDERNNIESTLSRITIYISNTESTL
jgi:hypothetical protein